MTFGELETAGATWVRGFFAMPDADEGEPGEAPAISTLLQASARGYGTVLSLKFPSFPERGKPLPRPGTDAMNAELRRLDQVLPAVLDEVDVLVIGNEPFIECPHDDWNNGAINAFYEAVADHVIEYRAAHFPGGCRTALYMGALNHLEGPGWTGAGTERWMTYVRDTPEIEGTDIHPHVASLADSDAYLDYVLPRLGPDKKFLVTEFSLVQLWEEHLTDRVAAEYAAKYGVPPGTRVWQVIKKALDEPFPQDRWYDFLRTSPWFENNKDYLRDQVRKFRATGKLAVATYGIGQDTAMSSDFGPGKKPWLLNSLFASRSVQPLPDGTPAPNYAWLDEFKALQHR
ncbi:hypothetical protein OU415_28260 [Saccharopolyspora sp. WRP15-2]|uniref:GH26 domain-containing protein n=1 Tax=Saccharopolyspora oryzae TaxID=2997343 RepID=A0ABT4V5X5_9PSEU|nr:hypothetical protein [Saccharopolyspora oryzae]MDA3629353.1 hypothetical protein [Saccharopolyspora oryzae]